MHADTATIFDGMAAGYDLQFTHSLTGTQQRLQSRKWLSAFLANKPPLHILEINCGTGEDALWLASLGHHITATDASAAMITEAKRKTNDLPNPVDFVHCPFSSLEKMTTANGYDLIFSNFAGLNCLSPAGLRELGEKCAALLQPGGYMAVVVFGTNCCWEVLYYLAKGRPATAFRRWKQKPPMMVTNGYEQPVYYYAAKRLGKLFGGFQQVEQRPVGLFIPPSYMEEAMKKRRGLFSWLVRLEKRAGHIPAFSRFADHYYLLLKKK